MFKSIKEFFVGKPKVEEKPAECPYKAEVVPAPEPVPEPVAVVEPTPAPVVEPAPVVQEINITTVTLSDQITDAVTVTAKPDTIPTGVWPFPNGVPPEPEVKKKRTFVKREEPVTEKKLTPAITANKTKPRKKK
jgi:hypothetical protein